ncbi:hypothetical protein [Chryseobacterium carnipullorum]|nr:hypothetical protein [Chryseobacterium carnipullorum]STC94833.1 Uncharacterised protein [Chryseobacterium carnipullorum]
MVENFNPNILIYQLGDNTSVEGSNAFKESSITFLKKFKTKFVISPFFMSALNFNTSKEIALKSSSYFIDISKISNNPINQAHSDKNRNDISKWKVDGISAHPGNTGMQNISHAIFAAIIPKN